MPHADCRRSRRRSSARVRRRAQCSRLRSIGSDLEDYCCRRASQALGKSAPNAFPKRDDKVITGGTTRRAATAKRCDCGGPDLRLRGAAMTGSRNLCRAAASVSVPQDETWVRRPRASVVRSRVSRSVQRVQRSRSCEDPMHYRTLLGTALNVSEVCLGTMTLGQAEHRGRCARAAQLRDRAGHQLRRHRGDVPGPLTAIGERKNARSSHRSSGTKCW